jgi:hypothetical protein
MWQTRMRNARSHWVLLALLIAISPHVYAIIQGYWALLLVPVIKILSVKAAVPMAATMILMDFVASLFVALLLSLPLGYVTKERSFLFSILLGLGLLPWLLWARFDQEFAETSFTLAVLVGEYVAVVLAFIIMARIGAHLRILREKIAT